MKKINFDEYIIRLLTDFGCKGIEVGNETIHCQCPFHFPKHNFKTFHISRKEITKYGDIPVFNCFSCHRSGNIYGLIAHVERCTYKRAIKLFKKQVLLDGVTIELLNKELRQLTIIEEDATLPEIELPSISDNQGIMYEYMRSRSRRYHGILDVDYIVRKYELFYCGSGREQGRIIMPIRNLDGRYVCFNDRVVNEEVKNKSLHIEGLPYGDLFYGMFENIDKKIAVVVEGAFDTYQVECAIQVNKFLRKHCGLLCLMGSVFTDARQTLIIEHFERVLLLGDHDDEGITWSYGAYMQLKDDIDVKICTEQIPKRKDPGKCTVDQIVYALKNGEKPERKTYIDWMTKKYGFNL